MVSNTCYNCGAEIPDELHFCDANCASQYKKAHPNIRRALATATKLRRGKGLPSHVKEGTGGKSNQASAEILKWCEDSGLHFLGYCNRFGIEMPKEVATHFLAGKERDGSGCQRWYPIADVEKDLAMITSNSASLLERRQ